MRNTRTKLTLIGFFAVLTGATSAQAKEQPPTNRVPLKIARKTATAYYPGRVQGEELEFEDGKWIYSFDLTSEKDMRVHEVHVDALSGKVIGMHAETASDEKKEQEEDESEAD